jgi:hypothetical protein
MCRDKLQPQGGAIKDNSRQPPETAIAAATGSVSLSPEALIDLQRKTVAEHVRNEQIKNWPEVYRTFTPHDEDAFYDVVTFQTRFRKKQGVVDFYEAFTLGFPDFEIILHTQHDVPEVSILEVQIREHTKASTAE